MKPVELDYRMTKQGFLEPVIEVSNARLKIGKYGSIAMSYLKNENPYRYSLLRAEGTLMETMYKVNEEAHQMMEVLQKQMLMKIPILDPENFYESYKHREMIRARAEEIVLSEIVYMPR
ncbi:MAG: TnpV protein [Maledivibacter sp.]|jgi:hypothetical protein|nr:TnpV protein [Maledivibacter sp.]